MSTLSAADGLAELLGCADRTELLPALENVTNVFGSLGLDVRDIRDQLLRDLYPDEAEWIATWHRGPGSPSAETDNEIAACYRALRGSAASGDEETYRRVMARLRELQAVEAQQIRRSFEADTLDRDQIDDALRRADDLLARYEGPPR